MSQRPVITDAILVLMVLELRQWLQRSVLWDFQIGCAKIKCLEPDHLIEIG